MKVKRSLALVLSVLLIMTAVIPAAVAADENLDRIFGADRFLTAVEIALEGWEDGADVVVLANGLNFPDALAGVPLAAALDAPILLTGAAELNEDTAAAIEELEAEEVIILGGEAAVSKAVFEELEDMGLEVERVFGDGRWDTAVAIAEKLAEVLDVDEFETAVVVYARNFPDALAAASYAAINEMPIFLTDTDEVSEPTADALEAFNVEEVLVVGGKSVISDAVVKELDAERIAGDTREETSVALAERFELETELYYMATGYNFADAIAGAALAAKEGTGILLVGQSLPKAVRDFLQTGKVMDVVVFGGTNAVATTVVNNVAKNLFNPYIINVEGVTELTKTHVTITFHPLADDIEDATIEVIDNKGNVIEVDSVNLVVNETETTFDFVRALTSAPEGVWVIEGFEYDVDTVNALAAINGADSELKFYNALVKYGFDNIILANATAYYNAKDEAFESLAEVQEFIDEVNADVVAAGDYADLIEALEDALTNGSHVLILHALNSWERVNSAQLSVTGAGNDYIDLLTTYGPDHTVADLEAEFEAIQEVIDNHNLTVAENAVAAAEGTAVRTGTDGYNAAVTAVGFVKPDEDDETDKADLQDRLALLNLVIKVKEAGTAAQLANAYNALVAYVDDEDEIGTEEFYTALREDYRAAVKDASVLTHQDIEDVIVTVNTMKRAALYNTVEGLAAAATKTAVTTALNNLAAYVELDGVVESRWEAYLANFVANLAPIADGDKDDPAVVETAIEALQDEIDAANASEVAGPLEDISKYDKDDASTFPGTDPVAGLLALLKDTELALGNVVDANAAAYYAERDSLVSLATVDFTDADAVTGGRTDLKYWVEALNQTQTLAKAASAAEARPVLGWFAIEAGVADYTNLTAAQKTEIAGLFINNAKWGADSFMDQLRSTGTKLLKDYTDPVDVAADLDDLVDLYTDVLVDINSEPSIVDMVNFLDALDYAAYNVLTHAQQIDVADYFIENFPADDEGEQIDFKTFGAIQALIDKAIAATK